MTSRRAWGYNRRAKYAAGIIVEPRCLFSAVSMVDLFRLVKASLREGQFINGGTFRPKRSALRWLARGRSVSLCDTFRRSSAGRRHATRWRVDGRTEAGTGWASELTDCVQVCARRPPPAYLLQCCLRGRNRVFHCRPRASRSLAHGADCWMRDVRVGGVALWLADGRRGRGIVEAQRTAGAAQYAPLHHGLQFARSSPQPQLQG